MRSDEDLTLVFSLSSPGWVQGGVNGSGGLLLDTIATGNVSLVRERVEVGGWKEVCNPMFNPLNGGTTLACSDKSMLWRVPKSPSALDPAFDVVRGPFLVFSPPPLPPPPTFVGEKAVAPTPPPLPPVEGARLLVRCALEGGHFLAVTPASVTPNATSVACGEVVEGGRLEEVVGWVAGKRGGGWESGLTRCFSHGNGGFWYHTVRLGPLGGCAEGDVVQEVLGFVI